MKLPLKITIRRAAATPVGTVEVFYGIVDADGVSAKEGHFVAKPQDVEEVCDYTFSRFLEDNADMIPRYVEMSDDARQVIEGLREDAANVK